MPTRLYYAYFDFSAPFTGSAYLDPPASSTIWAAKGSDQIGTEIVKLTRTRGTDRLWGGGFSAYGSGVAPFPIGLGQCISDHLKAQLISGFVKGQLFAWVQSQANLLCPALIIRVVSGDFLTERGILLEYLPDIMTKEIKATWAWGIHENRHFPPVVKLNPVVCQDGDVIVVELGLMCFTDSAGLCGLETYNIIPENTILSTVVHETPPKMGGRSSPLVPNDAPEDETSLCVTIRGERAQMLNPWIEFSQDIEFFGGPRATMSTNGNGGVPRTYTGAADVAMLAMGATLEPGVDYLTGYGLVDLSFLSGDPPYASVLSDFPLELSASFATVAVIGAAGVPVSTVGAGGFKWGGTGVITFANPPAKDVVGSGGFRWAGSGVIRFVAPAISSVLRVVGSGGFKWGGKGVIQFSNPTVAATPPVLAIVGSGGFLFGGQGQITSASPPALAIVGSGGFVWGAFRVPELTVVRFISPADKVLVAVTGSGGFAWGGTGAITFTTPPTFAVPGPEAGADASCKFGGAGVIAFISPQILEVIGGDGGFLLGGEVEPPDRFDTYSLFGARGEPSIYSNFNFNSYAIHRDQPYGAGPEGIYLLSGTDDDGKEIHSGIRIGPVSFGTERKKRMRLVRCGGITDEAQVKVSDGNGNAGYYDVVDNIAACSRDIEARELTIEISGFSTLEQLELVPLILSKR